MAATVYLVPAADVDGGAMTGRRTGHHGGPTVGVRLEAGHQRFPPERNVTEVGTLEKPRTLTEWTRSRPSGSMS